MNPEYVEVSSEPNINLIPPSSILNDYPPIPHSKNLDGNLSNNPFNSYSFNNPLTSLLDKKQTLDDANKKKSIF